MFGGAGRVGQHRHSGPMAASPRFLQTDQRLKRFSADGS